MAARKLPNTNNQLSCVSSPNLMNPCLYTAPGSLNFRLPTVNFKLRSLLFLWRVYTMFAGPLRQAQDPHSDHSTACQVPGLPGVRLSTEWFSHSSRKGSSILLLTGSTLIGPDRLAPLYKWTRRQMKNLASRGRSQKCLQGDVTRRPLQPMILSAFPF